MDEIKQMLIVIIVEIKKNQIELNDRININKEYRNAKLKYLIKILKRLLERVEQLVI